MAQHRLPQDFKKKVTVAQQIVSIQSYVSQLMEGHPNIG